MKWVMIVAVAMFATSAASEDDFPIVDVEVNCGRIQSRILVADCIKREQMYYDLSRSGWETLTEEAKAKIRFWENPRSTVNATSHSFYQLLWAYVEREQMIEQQRRMREGPLPRFRY